MAFKTKRVYDPAEESDGIRLLVDRLWPRDVSKESAQLDGWVKALAPSTLLRTWFGHKMENFAEFSALYRAELDASADAQAAAREIIRQSKENTVTLLFGTKNTKVNHAVVLKAYLEETASRYE